MSTLLAATSGDVTKAGKAIGLALGVGLGALGAGVGIGNIFGALIQVTPGLMIWTIVCFLITLYVLKRFAFGPIQKLIDERRERSRGALAEADEARDEA